MSVIPPLLIWATWSAGLKCLCKGFMDLAVIPPLYCTGDVVNESKITGDSRVSEGETPDARVLGRKTDRKSVV